MTAMEHLRKSLEHAEEAATEFPDGSRQESVAENVVAWARRSVEIAEREADDPEVRTDGGTEQTGTEQIGASCDACDWTLNIEEVVERIEDSNVSLTPTPERVRRKFGSLAQGHAYFNRGHRIETHLSTEEIAEVLD